MEFNIPRQGASSSRPLPNLPQPIVALHRRKCYNFNSHRLSSL
ncbi:hypothetical protein QQP08_009060 [Theobroma cacao]|nr:hypothetical protein QQP08_009060 [Theobroma cacao]